MRALRPRIETLASGLLDALTAHGPPADLHAELAVPLPILVICELLGVPYADRDRFRAWSQDAGNTRDHARSQRGLGELYAYGLQLVAAKRETPEDDVISRLCATDDVTDPVTDEEAAELSMGVLFAGHETTVARIGLGTMALLGNRDQWQALVADPRLVPGAVEEILRAPGSGDGGMPRYARTDLEIHGLTIQAGDLVLLDISAANHDPTAFADPETVNLTRAAAAHLTFGHGARYCLGAPLARIELDVVLTALVRRLPNLHLAVHLADIPLRHDTLTGGPAELPVQW
jgi:cytochrome P450